MLGTYKSWRYQISLESQKQENNVITFASPNVLSGGSWEEALGKNKTQHRENQRAIEEKDLNSVIEGRIQIIKSFRR